MDWSIKITDIAMVLAAFLGPAAAVFASELRQRYRQRNEYKMQVFQVLMKTRGASKLRTDHVEAINQIEFAFPRKSCPDVEDARYQYRKHLRNPDASSEDPGVKAVWEQKSKDLFADMLYQMAKNLKLPFSKSDIVEDSYKPDAYLFDEMAAYETKHLLLKLLRNESTLKLNTTLVPGQTEEEQKKFIEMQDVWKNFISGNTTIHVNVDNLPEENTK